MNANQLKQPLDFLESLDNQAMFHHAAGWFRHSQAAGKHFASLRDQGFPIPGIAARFIEPLATLDSVPQTELEPEPTPPHDPIDGNLYATQIVTHLRSFLPYAATNFKNVGKHYAVTSPADMNERGEAIKGLLYAVIDLATEEGIIVTIERKPFPDGKPAMGHAYTQIETRWERKIYQHFMNLGNDKVRLKATHTLNRELADYEWENRNEWQKENGGPKRELYMELGWIVNGRTIKTEEELTEYLRKTAIAVGLSVFEPVPPPNPHNVTKAQVGLSNLLSIYDKPKNTMNLDSQIDHAAGMPISLLKDLPDLPPPEVLSTIASLAERGTPLATKLAEQGIATLRSLADVKAVEITGLDEGSQIPSLEVLNESPVVLGHPYAPYPMSEGRKHANPHVGSTLDSFLQEEGILDECSAEATKIVEAANNYIDDIKDERAIPVTMNQDGSIEYYPV